MASVEKLSPCRILFRNSSSCSFTRILSSTLIGGFLTISAITYEPFKQLYPSTYKKNLTEDESSLVGNWNMQEGCSYYTCDLSSKGNTGYIAKCNWCATEFPFVKETNSTNNPDLIVPVMNYNVENKHS